MPNDTQPQIFLSYSWANKDIADAIDNDFKSVGITFLRDERNVNYTGSIKEFMQLVGKSNFVVMLISTEYLRSENCMYEVTELLSSHEFEKRILPVMLSKTNIHRLEEQEKYYDYWLERVDYTKKLAIKHPHEKTIEDKKRIENVYNCLNIFFKKITEIKYENYDDLKTKNYKPMLDKIGFNGKEILHSVIAISKIHDKEERELALEHLPNNYRDNKYVLFQKALNAQKNGQYKIAKANYETLLKNDTRFVLAYNNLGLLLENHFSNFDGARRLYEEAIEINYPQFAEPHSNLALLLSVHFSEYLLAKKHFEKAIEINPQHADAMVNFANLLSVHLLNFEEARKHFEKAIEINPDHIRALYNYAIFLEDHFTDYDGARKLYEKAIEINPKFAPALFNLGGLLIVHFSDFNIGSSHIKKSIKLEPKYEAAYNSLLELINLPSEE